MTDVIGMHLAVFLPNYVQYYNIWLLYYILHVKFSEQVLYLKTWQCSAVVDTQRYMVKVEANL